MDPGKHNRTRFTQILVVVDGFSRLIRTYPLKDKKATNGKLLQYIAWAERQMERKVKCVCLMVEESSGEMEAWYNLHGVEFVDLSKGASSLNLAERAIQ
ncbi:LOW QUALITY PROTEIN: Polyprotein [Phytophthora palmivora]|uniref:Polyprotein n=1 Tax=Phytophthora palmivora TaxID=4796 RepID=A0A2P4XGN2_9STRA|nr:LOW QUALITY PROTEIN: Polyprotein [Phytophthora palmivora]